MRQWYKHVVGIETTSNSSTKDHAWNEISGRYVPVEEYYEPLIWRKQSDDNKQASEGQLDVETNSKAIHAYNHALQQTKEMYDRLVTHYGVAKEQARIILPLSQYTEVYWTASFQAIMNFIELRDEKTSQVEIQEYARSMKELMHKVYPKTTEIWSKLYW
jgi:thymidylate synthase (FAD)